MKAILSTFPGGGATVGVSAVSIAVAVSVKAGLGVKVTVEGMEVLTAAGVASTAERNGI